MSNDNAGNSEHGTNRSRRLRDEELSDDDLRQVELGALSILRAKEIQKQKDAEEKRAAEALRYSKVGVYHERRSLLMLVVEYTKLLCFIVVAIAAYLGAQHLLKSTYSTKPELLNSYVQQLSIGVVAFVILTLWLILRIYNLWFHDIIHADVNYISRTRKPIWYLGIHKISFKVVTAGASCNPMPTNFEVAMRKLGFDASSMDIDTAIQKDKPLHDLKYVKGADRLEEIINS